MSFFLVWRDSGVSLRVRISRLPSKHVGFTPRLDLDLDLVYSNLISLRKRNFASTQKSCKTKTVKNQKPKTKTWTPPQLKYIYAVALQQHSPHLRKFYPSEDWLMLDFSNRTSTGISIWHLPLTFLNVFSLFYSNFLTNY